MIKYLAIPFILVGCTAPVTDPPAHAIPQEQMEMIWEALEHLKEYDMLQNRTKPNDSINSALENFWEDTDGSNGATESEELLQLSSNED